MKGHGAKFGRKMEEAIVALLTHRNIEEAANTVAVSVKTLLRWQKLPEFAAAYREARRAAVSQANARLQQATGAASAGRAQTHGGSERTGGSPATSGRVRLESCCQVHRERRHRGAGVGAGTRRGAK